MKKYIKTFETFQTPFGDQGGNKLEFETNTSEGAARKLRFLIKDADIEHSLNEIEEMIQNGELDSALDSYDVNLLFANLIEKDRLDIADVLSDAGYKITNKKKVVDWLSAARVGDDKLYAVNEYL